MIDVIAFALPILTTGFFVWFFLRMRKPRKSKTAKDDPTTRQERAVWAWAKILSSSQGMVSSFHMARVEMQLRSVSPLVGETGRGSDRVRGALRFQN